MQVGWWDGAAIDAVGLAPYIRQNTAAAHAHHSKRCPRVGQQPLEETC